MRALAAGTSTKEPLFPAAGTWPGPAARHGARVGAQVLGPGSAAPCWMLSSAVSKDRACLACRPAWAGLGCPRATAEAVTPAHFQSHVLVLLNKKVP